MNFTVGPSGEVTVRDILDFPVPLDPGITAPRASTVAASTELSHELDTEAMRSLSLVQAQNIVVLMDMNLALWDKCKQFRVRNEQAGRELTSFQQKLEHANQRLKQATAPGIAPSAPVPMDDHPVPVPPYNWTPRASTVAALTELSHELDKEAVILTDFNLALSDKCKQFRVETEQKGRELTSVKQKLERANQRLKQATAPGIAPSAPDAEEARLPLGVGRGQLINMMGAAASQPAPGAPSSFRSKRCARPCLPDIEPTAPAPQLRVVSASDTTTTASLSRTAGGGAAAASASCWMPMGCAVRTLKV